MGIQLSSYCTSFFLSAIKIRLFDVAEPGSIHGKLDFSGKGDGQHSLLSLRGGIYVEWLCSANARPESRVLKRTNTTYYS